MGRCYYKTNLKWTDYELNFINSAIINIERLGHSIYFETKRLQRTFLAYRTFESIRQKINEKRRKK